MRRMSAHSISLPGEEDIDLASLLVADASLTDGRLRSTQYSGAKGPLTFSPGRVGSSSPAQKLVPSESFQNIRGEHKLGETSRLVSDPPDRNFFGNTPSTTLKTSETKRSSHESWSTNKERSYNASKVDLSELNTNLGTAELFSCRESMLIAADYSKSVVDILLAVEREIDRQGIINANV